jgi:hypothetical protein
MSHLVKPSQVLITRLPYAPRFKPTPILEMAKHIDARGLICLSMPLHVEHPNNGGRLVCELEDAGLICVALVAWFRDRHIVTTKSRRLTNTWEPLAIMALQKNYHINREAATKIKKGFEGREGAFEEDEFLTCIGDHWPCRNDRRDRRFLPAGIVLNCGQLADLQPGDRVLDPYGNPGVRDACEPLGWQYVDAMLPSPARNAKKSELNDEDEDLPRDGEDEEQDLQRDSRSI